MNGPWTVEEVAKMLKLGERTVSSPTWRAQNGLTGFKVGRKWLFTSEDVEALIAKARERRQHRDATVMVGVNAR